MPQPLNVGLVGAGIGGLAAAISLKVHGGEDVQVTILEAAAELGEIGAGIQMTPNVARLLIRWGVADVIGDNLVEFEALNLRTKDGTLVGHAKMDSERWTGVPWWLVHRMHLHDGLVTVARRVGVNLVVNARVSNIDYKSSKQVHVSTEAGKNYTFDIVIGSDGINSVVRRIILPHVKPTPPTGNCAYRAIVPYEQIRKDPSLRGLVEKQTMEVWMGAQKGQQHGYIISYPISAGRDFNMVLSHHRDHLVSAVEEADMDELRDTYKDYDPRIRKIIAMIPDGVKRWPLMVTRSSTWSNAEKNVVLMGDAAHSMVNHMAQGAATSMEDGAFLGVLLAHVAKDGPSALTIPAAIALYEKERMPLADMKQQVSYMNGAIWHLHDGSPAQKARDRAMQGELRGEALIRSPNLYADPWTWRVVYEYDPEQHARSAIEKALEGKDRRDPVTHVTAQQADLYMNWFLPEESKVVKARM